MGQTRPVTAIKLMIKDSVEEKLHTMQLKKASLANISINKLSRRELMAQKVGQAGISKDRGGIANLFRLRSWPRFSAEE